MSTEKSETDVLVVGSGAAGLFAAIRAKETGARVIVVEKGQSGFSGASAYGPQYIRVIFPGDDYDKSAKQTIVWSDYLAPLLQNKKLLNDLWAFKQHLHLKKIFESRR